MTAQIGDKFLFNDQQYTVVALSQPIDFHPSQYGITPSHCCTACWRGYRCEYSISAEGIFLEKLFVHTSDEVYPPINGIVPSQKKAHIQYMGHEVYEGLHIRIPYTGKILAGDDFMHEYYIHMGHQRAWAYKTLVEFVFENGKLTEQNDQSGMAAKLREMISRDDVFPAGRLLMGDVASFVDESFSLDYDTKAWWL